MSLEDTHVSLAHGNGGRYMRELIAEVFVAPPREPVPAHRPGCGRAALERCGRRARVPTDSFTVPPIEFPGGNIGSLAVHGTTNDLAVAGSIPKYLSLGVLLEEGLEFAVLERIVG